MKSFAKKVYQSPQWKKCRASYLKSVGGLCERCLAKGIYRPANIVHHKIFLDEKNVSDPEVCFAFKNLEAVCWEHHAEIHNNQKFLPHNDYSGPLAHPGRSLAQLDRASAHSTRSAVQPVLAADQHTC